MDGSTETSQAVAFTTWTVQFDTIWRSLYYCFGRDSLAETPASQSIALLFWRVTILVKYFQFPQQ